MGRLQSFFQGQILSHQLLEGKTTTMVVPKEKVQPNGRCIYPRYQPLFNWLKVTCESECSILHQKKHKKSTTMEQ
jgi:hypothetical protein